MDSESKKLLRDRILLIGIPILVIVLIVLGCAGGFRGSRRGRTGIKIAKK